MKLVFHSSKAALEYTLLMRNTLAATLLCLYLAGCSEPNEEIEGSSQAVIPSKQSFANAVITDDVMGKWSRSCVLCHVKGEGGAPRIGNKQEWRPRLVKSEQLLLNHAVEGFGNMPPLGYCMACERDDLRALIKLMIGAQE